MPDFRKIAEDARQAHEAKLNEENKILQEEREQRKSVVDAGVKILQTKIVPLLEQARTEFAAQKIHMVVEERFDVLNSPSVMPGVKVQCVGPKRADGYQWQAKPVFISSDGQKLSIGTGRDIFSRWPEADIKDVPISEAAALVEWAAKFAVESYYAELKKQPYG